MTPRQFCTLALLIGSFFVSAGLEAAPCAASPTVRCLSGQRFAVEVHWTDFQGHTGQGQGVTLTPDTGYFWFFSENNVELVVKVLDARSFNNHFWVFFGALSNVEYTLKVTDTATGRTRTYQNPAGQFASVGDTAAFSGASAGGAVTHERVEAEGTPAPPGSLAAIQRFIEAAEVKAASRGSLRNAAVKSPSPGSVRNAAAFTPCPGTPQVLSLSNCRFQLQVEWRAQGTGPGQAVQLTNDTGYFWFFSESNVELIVKVLDARSFNGHFWVFYGALSNVEYTLTLKDSVTGSIRIYHNPSGAFASVGDTAAFRGGFSVAPLLDSAHAGSANLDDKGGSVTATGADGTVFILEVPPDALVGPETVTLTPVSRIDRFPYSGGLVAGVEIEPLGLELMLPATLTIRPASSPPVNRTLPFSYSRGGEDFILYPRAVDTSTLRLPLVRFGGYGAGQGNAADAAAQADKAPSGPLTPYLQRYAHEVFLRVLGQISQDELLARGIQIYREAFEQLVGSLPTPTGESGVGTFLSLEEKCPVEETRDLWTKGVSILGIEKQRQMLGIKDDGGSTYLENLIELLSICMQEAMDRCISRNDPYETLTMAAIARQLQLLGSENPLHTSFTEGGFVERCLRFELDFESKIVVQETSPNAGGTTRLKYRAHVPLRFSYGGNLHADASIWEGDCNLLPEVANLELSSGFGDCTFTVSAGDGTFTAAAAWIDVLGNTANPATKLLYNPGEPVAKATLTCDDGPIDIPILQWAPEYLFLHQDETWPTQVGMGFMARNWVPLRLGPGPSQNGAFFAMKSYERGPITWRPNLTATEETWIFLKHTPDAPMPDCSR
jgi:hypothetical protein